MAKKVKETLEKDQVVEVVEPDTEKTSTNENDKVSKKSNKVENKQSDKKASNAKKKSKDKKGGLGKMVKESISEVKKVNWPTFGKVVKQTGMVMTVVLVCTLILFGMDRLLSWVFSLLT
jgi:preprotein translocase subunit SecE